MQPLGKDVREFLALLSKHDVRFMIVGGFAVAAHGFPRFTKDLDVWIECSNENATRVPVFSFEDAFPKRVTGEIDGLSLPIIDRVSLAANKRAFGRALDLADAEELEK